MKQLLALGVLAAALVACGGATRAQKVAAISGVAADGKAIYDAQCSNCHGMDGKGVTTGTNTGTAVVDTIKDRTEESFIAATIYGVAGTQMASFANLSDQDLANVYAYIKETLVQ